MADLAGAEISHVANPRVEADSNELAARNDHLVELGLDPITLRSDLLRDEIALARDYADRIDVQRISASSFWNRDRAAASAQESIR